MPSVMCTSRQSGFTLPELLAAMIIGGLVLAGITRFAVPALKTLSVVHSGLTMSNSGQVALSHLTRTIQGVGRWQCVNSGPDPALFIGGGESADMSSDSTHTGTVTNGFGWPDHLPDLPERVRGQRLPGTDVLLVFRQGEQPDRACDPAEVRADVYFVATNVAGQPALFRKTIQPSGGRRQEIVSGVQSLQLLYGLENPVGARWITGNDLRREHRVLGARIGLTLVQTIVPGSRYADTGVRRQRDSFPVRVLSTAVSIPAAVRVPG